jgi:hypothetical protein
MIVYGAGFGRGTTVESVVNANTILLSTASANTSTNTRLSFVEPNKLVTAEIVGPGLCKAWVNFNGTGTVAIRSSFNVSSITDNGTGQYTVNFTTAMVDANYCWAGSAHSATANSTGIQEYLADTQTISSVVVRVVQNAGAVTQLVDGDIVRVAIFR